MDGKQGKIDAAAMLAQVQAWSAVNTGTANLAGLAEQADMLAEAFAALPGTVERVDPAPVTAIAAAADRRTHRSPVAAAKGSSQSAYCGDTSGEVAISDATRAVAWVASVLGSAGRVDRTRRRRTAATTAANAATMSRRTIDDISPIR